MRLVAALLVTLLSGCSASHHQQLAFSANGKAVIRDAYDGRLDHNWSCDSLRAAVGRLPALLGPPDRTPRCWFYYWSPDASSAIDGARLCFTGGRVSFVQTAVHF